MTLTLLDCLNVDCLMPKPYGFCEGLQERDPDTDPVMAQTGWPISDLCLGPMSVDCPTAEHEPPDEEMTL